MGAKQTLFFVRGLVELKLHTVNVFDGNARALAVELPRRQNIGQTTHRLIFQRHLQTGAAEFDILKRERFDATNVAQVARCRATETVHIELPLQTLQRRELSLVAAAAYHRTFRTSNDFPLHTKKTFLRSHRWRRGQKLLPPRQREG